MDYCGPRGIALSAFLGWDQADQDAALAWSADKSRRYPDGTHPDEWDESKGGSRQAYHPHVNVHPGAALIAAVQSTEEFEEAGPGAHVHLVRGSAAECRRCLRDAAARAHRDD
jgi:hypothetical protein